jgi:hypothetical protein
MTSQLAFRALTLWRPWDQAILFGGKDLENRDWAPWDSIIGKLIAIHAGKKFDHEGAEWMLEKGLYWPATPELCPTGIVGVARVTGAVVKSESPWFVGKYGWVLEDVRAFQKPIACPGAQGLWKVEGKPLEQLIAALTGNESEPVEVDPRQAGFDFGEEGS